MKSNFFFAFAGFIFGVSFTSALAQTVEVTSTGVGIGTAGPTSGMKLDVRGALNAGTLSGENFEEVAQFISTSGGNGVMLGGTATNGHGVIAPSGTNRDLLFSYWNGAANVETMRLKGGNVGIGTATPSYKLSIDSSTNSYLLRGHANGDFVFALAGDGAAGTNVDLFSIRNDNTGVVCLNTVNGARMALGVSTGSYAGSVSEQLSLVSSGNVGIGTTSPGYKLEVSGTVRATSFISNSTTYADFVFDPDYKLAPLAEVESAIKVQRHLSGIPSEAEAKAHGVDLGEMQVKLLQKVEELTLYLVAHEKALAAQQQELRQLREENAALRREVSGSVGSNSR